MINKRLNWPKPHRWGPTCLFVLFLKLNWDINKSNSYILTSSKLFIKFGLFIYLTKFKWDFIIQVRVEHQEFEFSYANQTKLELDLNFNKYKKLFVNGLIIWLYFFSRKAGLIGYLGLNYIIQKLI